MKKALKFRVVCFSLGLLVSAGAWEATAQVYAPRGGQRNPAGVPVHPRTGQPINNGRGFTHTPPAPAPRPLTNVAPATPANRHWVAGHWRLRPSGARVWMPGHWVGYGNGVCQVIVAPAPTAFVATAPVMQAWQFNQVVGAMQAQSFDEARLAIAKQAIGNNLLGSEQVSILMRNLTFESSRLDLAKFAYPFVADPQNYFVVNNAFQFHSSAMQLDHHLHQYANGW